MPRVCAVLFLLATATIAPASQPTPAERLDAIKMEQAAAEEAFRAAAAALQNTPEDRARADVLSAAFNAGQAARFAAAVDLAKADPKSRFALSALEWVLTNPRSHHLSAGTLAVQLVTRHHAADPAVGKIVAWSGYYTSQESHQRAATLALLRAVVETNPDRTARGQAAIALAWQTKAKFAVAERKHAADRDKLAAVAVAEFEAVARDYADCRWLLRDEDRTLGREAEKELYELRHLSVGMVAPELEGDDLDGVKFKLSDSRGKVTVLVFWATWCGPSMAIVPHERQLVARFKDRPFVMVGVNADEDRAKAQGAATTFDLTWRSFWNGEKGSRGPLSQAWNVRGWPTIYILDAKGVIRFKNPAAGDLARLVGQLVAEAQKK